MLAAVVGVVVVGVVVIVGVVVVVEGSVVAVVVVVGVVSIDVTVLVTVDGGATSVEGKGVSEVVVVVSKVESPVMEIGRASCRERV